MKLQDANLQVNEKNFFTHTLSCILPSFSQNTSRLLLPKRLSKCACTITFRNGKQCYSRSSRPEVFYKKGALRNFAKLTGKHPCQSLFLIKLFKKGLRHRCFLVNFPKFLRTPFLREDLRWLFLLFVIYLLFNYDSSKSTFFTLNMTFDVLLRTVSVK